jgi:integrating conjugative element protein (TIGR03749 family)
VYVHADNDRQPSREVSPRQSQAHGAPAYDYISLTRLAAKKLYAPARLADARPRIHRRPVNVKAVIKGLYRGAKLEARPLASWSADGLYVTAVQLRNRMSKPVLFDPRDLRGAWLAATAQHARLLPAGERGDTTALYLISDRPFADALPFLPSKKATTKAKTGKGKRGAGGSARETL